VDMDVYAYALGTVPGGREAEVGHLGADPGEGGEAFDGVGDVAVELVAEDYGGLFYVSSWGVDSC
jgi:hypothetical protein